MLTSSKNPGAAPVGNTSHMLSHTVPRGIKHILGNATGREHLELEPRFPHTSLHVPFHFTEAVSFFVCVCGLNKIKVYFFHMVIPDVNSLKLT